METYESTYPLRVRRGGGINAQKVSLRDTKGTPDTALNINGFRLALYLI